MTSTLRLRLFVTSNVLRNIATVKPFAHKNTTNSLRDVNGIRISLAIAVQLCTSYGQSMTKTTPLTAAHEAIDNVKGCPSRDTSLEAGGAERQKLGPTSFLFTL